METRTIPENDWVEFVNRFSRDHVGWLATVQVLDGRSGVLLVAKTFRYKASALIRRGAALARSR